MEIKNTSTVLNFELREYYVSTPRIVRVLMDFLEVFSVGDIF